MNKTVALIPARGGSKSIPLKNIKDINGRPLIFWTIDAAINCDEIDEVLVATDSEFIKKKVETYKAEINNPNINKLYVISRSVSSATDEASTETVMLEFAENHEFENIVLIQATSPLTEATHLNEGIKKYRNGYDSLLSVVRQKRFLWGAEEEHAFSLNYQPKNRPRRQEFQGHLVENGAFYITSKESLLQSKCRLSGKIGIYEMPEYTYYELDEPDDWIIIEGLLANKNKTQKRDFSKIKLFATDCDGVLTDAGMYYSEKGDELKKFNTRDGMGFALLKKQGIITAIITGEESELVKRRAKKLNVDEVFTGVKDKVAIMDALLEKYNLTYDNVLYIGDDINDMELIEKVGLSWTVADGHDSIKSIVNCITTSTGGNGAVREVIDLFLRCFNC